MLDKVIDKESSQRNRGQIMIIDYDRNPQLSVDRKLTSLCDSIQRAINELQDELNKLRKEVQKLADEQ